MNSEMDPKLHHQSVQRALALGRGANAQALPELERLLTMPSAEIRRLAASAVGKLASFGADADTASPSATTNASASSAVTPCAQTSTCRNWTSMSSTGA